MAGGRRSTYDVTAAAVFLRPLPWRALLQASARIRRQAVDGTFAVSRLVYRGARKALRVTRSLAGRGVRTLLRRSWLRQLAVNAKQSETVRRIVLPLLLRFPRLRSGVARLRVLSRSAPSGDIQHPDWPAPLPAEYLRMPASERRVLLDLARGGEPPSPP